jgi:hypothetical protein
LFSTLNGTIPDSTICSGNRSRSTSPFRRPFWKLTTTAPGFSTVASSSAAPSVAADFTVTNTRSASATAAAVVSNRSPSTRRSAPR